MKKLLLAATMLAALASGAKAEFSVVSTGPSLVLTSDSQSQRHRGSRLPSCPA